MIAPLRIRKSCEHCEKSYSVPISRAKSRFCCRACADAAHRTRSVSDIACEVCETVFTAVADHGVMPRFCSRACFSNQKTKIRPEPKECATCGGIFMAEKSHTGSAPDGRRIYCSNKCRHEGLRAGVERTCLNCGLTFSMWKSKVALSNIESCCSQDCSAAYYRESRSPAWKGGAYMSQSAGHGFVALVRNGYVGKYIQEHRLVVSRIIGRPILRGEVVIHVNRNKQDLRPENLFLCESTSEFAKRRNGSMPWPERGNLDSFKVAPVRNEN